jgi:hypothetical protein
MYNDAGVPLERKHFQWPTLIRDFELSPPFQATGSPPSGWQVLTNMKYRGVNAIFNAMISIQYNPKSPPNSWRSPPTR